MTNADRIRRMTDEELAEFFGTESICDNIDSSKCKNDKDCKECQLEWLKQEAVQDDS